MTIKEKIEKQLSICGGHINLSDVAATEIMGALGYDFLWVDMEHTTLSCEQVHMHLLAARAASVPVFVRVPVDDFTVTKRVMEMGIDGIIFPMVKDCEHAKKLISYTLYPPYGTRGCGPKGAVRYGIDSESVYYGERHLQMCRFVQVELKSAALDAERIAQIPYLDGCILGMNDLSGSINRLGDIFCEDNLQLAETTIKAFKAVGKTVGVSTGATDSDTLKKYHDMGINMISTGVDYEYIRKGAAATLDIVRKVQNDEHIS